MSPSDDLRITLDALATRGRAHLRRERLRAVLPRALEEAVPWLVVVPAGLLVGRLLFGVGPVRVSVLVALAAAPAVLRFLAEIVPTLIVAVPREAALGILDGAVEGKDRLVAADEFLGRSTPSGFMAAAVEDAREWARKARDATVDPAPVRAPALARASILLLLAVAAGLGVLLLPVATPAAATIVPETVVAGGAPISAAENGEDPSEASRPPVPGREAVTRDPVSAAPDRAAVADPAAEDIPREAKETEGKTGSGPGAGGRAKSGANDARGVPSQRSPGTATPPGKDPEKAPSKPRKPAEEKEPGKRPKEVGDEGGRTSGRGSSRGSSQNPVASDWSSRDKVDEADDEPPGDDEEVDDEESESEARGGMQPSLRDRKPPVSRDLSIGFGNRPNPDAAGRGGPSQPKKSRGTASLVLGVPIPDRVKGQKNPGRTKITHERVEPRREETGPVDASARPPRAAPSGFVSRPAMSPWLARLVREYFLGIRDKGKGDER